MSQNKVILGSEEWCSFPELGIPTIKARVDSGAIFIACKADVFAPESTSAFIPTIKARVASGAKTSALHAINIAPFIKNEANWVKFDINPIQNNLKTVIHCEAPLVDKRIVKSSSGFREQKYLLGQPTTDSLKELYKNSEKASSGLRIGLLASNPELYSNKRIMEAGEMRGHEMHFLNIKECYMKLDAKTPEIHYRGGLILNQFDAVIPRIRPSITFYGCALTRQFEALNVYCLNSSTAITQSRDKLFSLQLLLQSGIDIPTTGFANSPLDTDDLIKMVGGSPLIVKLLEGTQGKGVVLAETKKAAESVINAFKSLNANILVQEFIKEANGKDIRCFVIDGKVVAAIQREAMPGEFRANIHLGGTASIIKVTSEEKRIAIKAAKAMDLKVAGVGIIRSSKGPLLLEVNSSPGLEGIEGATNKDFEGEMIQAFEKT